MKLYLACKKQLNRALGSHQSLRPWLVIFFVILLLIPAVFTHAQTALELQNKINEKDSDIDNLEQEIKASVSRDARRAYHRTTEDGAGLHRGGGLSPALGEVSE